MTTKEFSDNFDILLNSYNTPERFGFTNTGSIMLDEYEKSLFLSQAQEQIVISLYTGRNEKGKSFENTEELRTNLKSLIKTATIKEDLKVHQGLSGYSKFYILPPDVLFITYESAILDDEKAGCNNGSSILIVPITQDEFYRIMNNPFRQSNKRKALRLDNNQNIAEIISKYNIKDYTIRYLSKPTPIVLTDLVDVSIDGVNTQTECNLNSAMHRTILERAVALAIASRGLQNKPNV